MKLQVAVELEYREALILKTQPYYLTQFLVLCGTCAVLSALLVLGGLIISLHGFTIGISHPSDPFYTTHVALGKAEPYVYQVIGWLCLFYGSWMSSKWLEKMIGTWSRANNFERYDKTVSEEVREKYHELRRKATQASN